MKEKIKWGILGTGNIAHTFARCLETLKDDAELTAVGSRTKETAEKFAEEFNIPHACSSYEKLAESDDVDVIYISSPHTLHLENSVLCMKNKKAVLCEKPLAINSAQVEQMIETAQQQNVFFMEAMWMAFFPAIAKMKELINDGAIGELLMIKANLGFRGNGDPQGRLLNPELGGGALLDVGVYTIAFSQLIMDREPEKITAVPSIGKTGVDEQNAIILQYDNGVMATLNSAVQTSFPHDGVISGTEGFIRIPPLVWQPDKFVLCKGRDEEEFAFERLGNGYCFEAVETMNCLCQGKIESDIMSWSQSRRLMKTMDRIREQWGLKYPME